MKHRVVSVSLYDTVPMSSRLYQDEAPSAAPADRHGAQHARQTVPAATAAATTAATAALRQQTAVSTYCVSAPLAVRAETGQSG